MAPAQPSLLEPQAQVVCREGQRVYVLPFRDPDGSTQVLVRRDPDTMGLGWCIGGLCDSALHPPFEVALRALHDGPGYDVEGTHLIRMEPLVRADGEVSYAYAVDLTYYHRRPSGATESPWKWMPFQLFWKMELLTVMLSTSQASRPYWVQS